MTYDQHWYGQFERTGRSAEKVAKLVVDVVQPSSVIDIGCGLGTWLVAFRDLGVPITHGVDGDYVEREWLHIAPEDFRSHNLDTTLVLDRRYDLAVSLEVAEHVAPAASRDFVATLVGAAPVVLFSAAIPHQGGTHHRNERWQSAWAEMFAERGYVPFDFVRRAIWSDDEVYYFYRQNIVLYAASDVADSIAAQSGSEPVSTMADLDVVHPGMIHGMHVRRAAGLLKASGANAIRRRRRRPSQPTLA